MELSWKRQDEFWFTPTGKLKINASKISTRHLTGKMSDEDYKGIMLEMKKAKCDIITNEWENTFYTTGDKSLIELPNIIYLLDKALEEYNARFAQL
jgi:hypothetical protein